MNFKTLICSKALFLAALMPAITLAGEITWIDVRSAEEFQQQHVAEAINIPYEEVDAGVISLGLDKDAVIYLYCGSGRRADIARESLELLGYTGVVNVGGLDEALAEAEKTTP